MNAQLVQDLIVAWLPSLIALGTFIGVIVKTVKEFKELKKTVVDMKAIEDIKLQLRTLNQENYALKKQLNELLTKIDRIKRD